MAQHRLRLELLDLYSDRYLTTLNQFSLHNQLAGIPYEHIIILANTYTYGGGGIYNAYTLTTTHHADFRPVVVHELVIVLPDWPMSIITTTNTKTITRLTLNPGNKTSPL